MNYSAQSLAYFASVSAQIARLQRPPLALRRVGGVWFVRLFRVNLSFSISRN